VSPPAKRIVLPGLFALLGVAVLLGLGAWQLERRTWKEDLIATLTNRLAGPPVDLPAGEGWRFLDPANQEFRRVAFPAEFLHGQESLVYASGSALRGDVRGPGYWVFTPARLADGRVVVVNRGFVPQGREGTASRTEGQVGGTIDIVGALRWPETRGWFTPADDPARNTWFARDHLAMAAAKNWGAVAPFYIEQEAPVPPGGLPQPGAITVKLRNLHLQYALTWFALAGVLASIFVIWAVGSRRRDGAVTR
jgi:surfeit locus 1 family protein